MENSHISTFCDFILLQCLGYKDYTEDSTKNADTGDDAEEDDHAKNFLQQMEHLDDKKTLEPVPSMADSSNTLLAILSLNAGKNL